MASVCYADELPSNWEIQTKINNTEVLENEKLDKEIAESRKREDLLLKEVKLLEYELDVIAKKDTQ